MRSGRFRAVKTVTVDVVKSLTICYINLFNKLHCAETVNIDFMSPVDFPNLSLTHSGQGCRKAFLMIVLFALRLQSLFYICNLNVQFSLLSPRLTTIYINGSISHHFITVVTAVVNAVYIYPVYMYTQYVNGATCKLCLGSEEINKDFIIVIIITNLFTG